MVNAKWANETTSNFQPKLIWIISAERKSKIQLDIESLYTVLYFLLCGCTLFPKLRFIAFAGVVSI